MLLSKLRNLVSSYVLFFNINFFFNFLSRLYKKKATYLISVLQIFLNLFLDV